MDRGAWWVTVHGVAEELDMTQQLNNNKCPIVYSMVVDLFCTLLLIFTPKGSLCPL